MDVALLGALRSSSGLALLADAAALASTDDLTRSAELRRRHPAAPDLVAAALAQLQLRHAAVGKLGADAERWWLTREGLEQATRRRVAEHRAARLASYVPGGRLVDVGCGLGVDLVAALRAGLTVTGVDRDPLRVALTRATLAELGLVGEVYEAEAAEVDPAAYDVLFADPARRDARGRVGDPRGSSPGWELVTRWLRGDAVVKTGPAIAHSLLPVGIEAEWVSDDRDLVEAALWGGALAGVRRRATVLPAGDTLTDRDDPGPAAVGVAPPGAFWYEPDDAVVRAGLVSALARLVDGWLLDPHIAYASSDRAVRTPLARGYRVAEELPYREKALRAALRARDVGPLTVKKRGVDVVPERLRARLRLRGSTPATIVLTRVAGAGRAYLLAPLSSPDG